jgi:inosine/guanosine/xanthosine phosphorylase family protein
VQATIARIRALSRLRPPLALVLGSGFGGTLRALQVEAKVSYARLPGFPHATVVGHAGELLIGQLAGTPVIVLNGRAHYYEGHSMAQVTFAIRALAEYGVRDVLLTNAAGGISPRLHTGGFMLLADHINLMGANPLRGANPPSLPRFVDLTQAYDANLAALMTRAARRLKIKLPRGVYLAVSGPSYETPAEIRAFARLGADAVGMSTVPEVIAARHCGLRVAALSCITNAAAGRARAPLSHAEVLATGARAQADATRLLTEFARLYAEKI